MGLRQSGPQPGYLMAMSIFPTILRGDALRMLRALPDQSVDLVLTTEAPQVIHKPDLYWPEFQRVCRGGVAFVTADLECDALWHSNPFDFQTRITVELPRRRTVDVVLFRQLPPAKALMHATGARAVCDWLVQSLTSTEGKVLDPFYRDGIATDVCVAAMRNGRDFVGITAC